MVVFFTADSTCFWLGQPKRDDFVTPTHQEEESMSSVQAAIRA